MTKIIIYILFSVYLISCNQLRDSNIKCISSNENLKSIVEFVKNDTNNISFNFFTVRNDYSFKTLAITYNLEKYRVTLIDFQNFSLRSDIKNIMYSYFKYGVYFKSSSDKFTKYYCFTNKLDQKPLSKDEINRTKQNNLDYNLTASDQGRGYVIYKCKSIHDYRNILEKKKEIEYIDSLELIIVEKFILVKPCIK